MTSTDNVQSYKRIYDLVKRKKMRDKVHNFENYHNPVYTVVDTFNIHSSSMNYHSHNKKLTLMSSQDFQKLKQHGIIFNLTNFHFRL